MPYKVVMVRKSCIKGFPKQQQSIISRDNVAECVRDLITMSHKRNELVWYAAGEKHTFGLSADYDEDGDVVELRVFDQNRSTGRKAKSLWGYQTPHAWVATMYIQYPELIGKVNHIGTTEEEFVGLTAAQKKKIRDHLAGRMKRRTPIVCSAWAHLMGWPITVQAYYQRAQLLIGEILRVDDTIKRIDLDMGRLGSPLFRRFTSVAQY